MTAITRHRLPVIAPPGFGPPRLSHQLAARLDRIRENGERELGHVSAAERQEVDQRLPHLEEACMPPAPEIVDQWMSMVGIGVRNPPTAADYPAVVSLIVHTSGDLPRACWAMETLALFNRRGRDAAF